MPDPKYLSILEVSRKQAYIFSSLKLRENAERSLRIAYVTGSEYFTEAAKDVPGLYSEEKNLVNAGGGHTVLEFSSREDAVMFNHIVTAKALRDFPGMELFAAVVEYDSAKTPAENLLELTKKLETKKALRKDSFRATDLGFDDKLPEKSSVSLPKQFPGDSYYHYAEDFDHLLPKEANFLGVVHIDGNAMGTRVSRVYESCAGRSWDELKNQLRAFSEGIQSDFEAAFMETAEKMDYLREPGSVLPIRPVVLAGDDVCYVTDGRYALESARIFLECLSKKKNAVQSDLPPYAACAGVAIVHRKYPFHKAYDMAEELCSNAKKFGASIVSDGNVSAMDWHIEYGQLKENLMEQREDYVTEDGNALTLRPVTVVVPESVVAKAEKATAGVRTYAYFKALTVAMQGETSDTARSKIKELRTALKQGKTETSFYMEEKGVRELLYHANAALNNTEERRIEAAKMRIAGKDFELTESAFHTIGEKDFCLLFDAIEMMDCFEPVEEGGEA